jgi:signal transduction histidine kinase
VKCRFRLWALALCAALVPALAIAQVEIPFFYPVAVSGPITKIIDGMAADFEKENPGIKVKPIYTGTYQDSMTKALTAVKMDIGIALRSDNRARATSALEEASEITETALRGVRDLSQLLHPSMLDDFGLPETLAAYLRSFSKRTGIRAQFSLTGGDERMPPDVEVCLYRIVQEALTNVARHSGALSCSVSLSRGADSVELIVEDAGRGINLAANATDVRSGLGLMGMRERAQTLAGRFTLTNRPEGGTRIVVTLPVRPGAEPARKAG